ncbi:MAG: extracellular solute-binding protein [Clostridia bacterium]|nr:extracellular solute-binding protein [Clostridia bacterium]
MLVGNAFGERSVCFYGFDSRSSGYTSFVKTHPGVKVRKNKKVYYNTKQILNDFITGEMPYDVFTLSTDSFDIYSLMEKGYLAPVTDNESIQSAMESMYAPFREQLSYEGVLYGVPYGCSISYYAYDPDAWTAAGFTAEDVPTSFASYLDFLEQWVLRIQEKPEKDIRVCGYFDERQYGSDSYILYLVQLLMDQHILQSDYSNQPLRFDTDEFRTLLERCQRIGKDLYTYEPKQNGTYSLFTDASSFHSLLYYVPLRLTEDQPILVKATIIAGFINIRSQEIELSKEYLGQKLQDMSAEEKVYFYPDADNVANESYVELAAAFDRTFAKYEAQLNNENLSEEERSEIMARIEKIQDTYEKINFDEHLYVVPPEDLEIYKQYGDRLYFQAPSVFDPNTEDGQKVRRLEEQYALGEITTDQFVKELDQLVQMLEMEDE